MSLRLLDSLDSGNKFWLYLDYEIRWAYRTIYLYIVVKLNLLRLKTF